jgi:hypothetical protein
VGTGELGRRVLGQDSWKGFLVMKAIVAEQHGRIEATGRTEHDRR